MLKHVCVHARMCVSLLLYLLQEQVRKLKDKLTEARAREQPYTACISAVCARVHVSTHQWSQTREDWAGYSPECCPESHPRGATHSWDEGCRRAGQGGACGAQHMGRRGCSRGRHTTDEERPKGGQNSQFRPLSELSSGPYSCYSSPLRSINMFYDVSHVKKINMVVMRIFSKHHLFHFIWLQRLEKRGVPLAPAHFVERP